MALVPFLLYSTSLPSLFESYGNGGRGPNLQQYSWYRAWSGSMQELSAVQVQLRSRLSDFKESAAGNLQLESRMVAVRRQWQGWMGDHKPKEPSPRP